MRWRNQILALACLIVFGALGILYFQTWVVQKPFAIILFVGEGLTSQRLAATRVYHGGVDTSLTIDALEFSGRLRNHSLDFAVPDTAAAASALATGLKVKNGALSIDASGRALQTILEIAHERGRSTGIVTDGELTNATCAAFYAHSTNGKQSETLANFLFQSPTVDIAFGGGAVHFPSQTAFEHTRVARTLTELENISVWQRPRVLGIFAERDLPFSDEIGARVEKPSLAEMVRHAIEILQLNRRGYFLVVNAHLMAAAALENAGERTLRETAELDQAVQIARDYAGTNTAILVAGDLALGGMSVNGFPYRYDSGVAILGLNSSGQPWITWATGPNGRMANNDASEAAKSVNEPAAIPSSYALNTIEDPIVSATGPRMERVHGTIDNTEVFSVLRDAL